jgi:6-phosphogluconate dehydrogenase (decarboxylating)
MSSLTTARQRSRRLGAGGPSTPLIEEAVAAEALPASRHARFRSGEQQSFADKPLSTMCTEFWRHVEAKAER